MSAALISVTAVVAGALLLEGPVSAPAPAIPRASIPSHPPIDAPAFSLASHATSTPVSRLEPVRLMALAGDRVQDPAPRMGPDLATLRIRAATPGGVVPDGLTLIVEGSPGLFAQLDAAHRDFLEELPDGTSRCRIPFATDGTVIGMSLRRSKTGKLSIEQSIGDPIWKKSWWSLLSESGRDVEVDVTLSTVPVDFSIRVLDHRGYPLSQARVKVTGFGRSQSGTTNADGIVEIVHWRTDAFVPVIRKTGYGTLVGEVIALAGDGDRIDLVLHAGRSLAVNIRDEHGRPVEAYALRATQNGQPLHSRSFPAPGTHRFSSVVLRDLSRGPLELVATLIGGEARQQHDPGDGAVTIVVPSHGTLSLKWNEVLPAKAEHTIEFSTSPAGGLSHRVTLFDWEKRNRGLELDCVLPGTYTARLTEISILDGTVSVRTLLELAPVTVEENRHFEAWMHLSPDRGNPRPLTWNCILWDC